MLFDPRFLITLYRCSYSSFPPLGCAFGFWFRRPSFWGCQTHGARNTTKLCTGARSMDSFISFHNQNNQTIRIQQSWTNNHGFVSAFRNKKNPFRGSNIRDPFVKGTVVSGSAGSFWNLQNPLAVSDFHWFPPWCYKFWKEFVGTHCSQLSVGASRGVLLWLMSSVTQIHQPRPTLSVSVGYLAQLTWGTLKVKSPGIMVTFAEMNNTRWYNWTSMKIIEHQVWDLPFSKLSMPASAAHQLAVSSSINPGFIKVDRGSGVLRNRYETI